MAWRNRVEVSYGALAANVRTVRTHVEGRKLIAVVKADAYGLGLERCARIYHEAGADLVAVASLGEADRVRKAVPGARVMLLGPPLPEEREAVAASGYEAWCSSLVEVREFADLAERHPDLGVHIAVDTGMGRSGCAPETAVALVAAVRERPGLRLAGICTHYPMALDTAFTDEQDRRFSAVLDAVPDLPGDCLIHCANSEGTLTRATLPGNAVRCGLLLTGVVPDGCPDPGLCEAVRWVSSLSLVKDLPAGHNVSYSLTHRLERDSRVALVPVGYADGYPLALSNAGAVLVQGRRCSILGRVTMDYLVVDCTDLPRPATVGDRVVLLGDRSAGLGVTDLARACGTIPYDILCGLRGRCEVVGVA